MNWIECLQSNSIQLIINAESINAEMAKINKLKKVKLIELNQTDVSLMK